MRQRRLPRPDILIDIGGGLFVEAKSLDAATRKELGIRIPLPLPYRYKKRKRKRNKSK